MPTRNVSVFSTRVGRAGPIVRTTPQKSGCARQSQDRESIVLDAPGFLYVFEQVLHAFLQAASAVGARQPVALHGVDRSPPYELPGRRVRRRPAGLDGVFFARWHYSVFCAAIAVSVAPNTYGDGVHAPVAQPNHDQGTTLKVSMIQAHCLLKRQKPVMSVSPGGQRPAFDLHVHEELGEHPTCTPRVKASLVCDVGPEMNWPDPRCSAPLFPPHRRSGKITIPRFNNHICQRAHVLELLRLEHRYREI